MLACLFAEAHMYSRRSHCKDILATRVCKRRQAQANQQIEPPNSPQLLIERL
jgi:hypothetical protein